MRIVCISDTHSLHRQLAIPNGDILIHAGDLTSNGEKSTVLDFNEWLGELPHPYKIVVPGNHDYGFGEDGAGHESLLTNAIYLNNSSVTIEGLRIWGSPVSPISPKFGIHGIYAIRRGSAINEYWQRIPANTDILVTHCPPYGILDKNEVGSEEGCKDLLKAVKKRIKPRLHVFGHIHSGYGHVLLEGIQYVNAANVGVGGKLAQNRLARLAYRLAISLYLFRLLNFIKRKLHHQITAKMYLSVSKKPVIIDL
ncbi:metallophosphatase domain-containing protein [Spirosoma koreense]